MSDPSLPSWWDKEKKRQNTRSRRQERKLAKDGGGRVTPGSGSSWRSPGDVRWEDALVEAKYTDQKGFRLLLSEIKQHWERAAQLGRDPVFIVEFSGDDPPLRVAITPYEPPQ